MSMCAVIIAKMDLMLPLTAEPLLTETPTTTTLILGIPILIRGKLLPHGLLVEI